MFKGHLLTGDADPNDESAQGGVETHIVGISVAGSHHYQPMPTLFPSFWFGIPTPGSILKGTWILSGCVDPRLRYVQKLTVRTGTCGEDVNRRER